MSTPGSPRQQRPTTSWRLADDPHNPENTSAGNGGDLVKHTIYAVLLDTLLAHDPWKRQLRLRECHAGRGVYAIPPADPRREALRAVHRGDPQRLILLASQRRALERLAVEPSAYADWYIGSACANAVQLARAGAAHSYQGYEWSPDTRAILAKTLAAADLGALVVSIPHGPPPAGRFDGELHIAAELPGWDARDVILLDPFGVWRRPKLAERRARFRRLLDAWLLRGADSPPLSLFFTWSSEQAARGDLDATATEVSDGYQAQLRRLCEADRRPLSVRWRWDGVFTMWLWVPASLRGALHVALDQALTRLARHMRHSGLEGPTELEIGDA